MGKLCNASLHLAACALAGMGGLAWAQTAPDAGSLQRETERQMAPRPAPALSAPPAPMPEAAKGATVQVQGFVIEGASLVPLAELEALLAPLVGQTLSFAALETAARQIAEHYRARGWYARAYLPAQDITAGRVRIVVVEGRLSGIEVDAPGLHADAAEQHIAARMVSAGLTVGAPLSAAALERGLLLANEQPGLQATGILEPGGQTGETRLRLKVTDSPALTGDLGLTNHGARATGVEQFAAGLAYAPGDGSQLRGNALAARGLESLRLAYTLPIGADGWRVSLHASELRYRLGGDFAALDADGRAQTAGLGLTYPLLRSAIANLRLSLSAEHRRYADDSLGTALRRKRADTFTLGLAGDRSDGLWGGGFTQASATLVQGKLDLSGVAADAAADRAGPRAAGGYLKLAGRAERLQRITDSLSLSATLNAQWAADNLDSSEKFALGGPFGIRAYPVSEASGDAGWLANLELRYSLDERWQAIGFLDGGEIRQHTNPWAGWQGGGSQPNRYGLAGAGLGLVWRSADGIDVQLALASPLGGHSGKTASGDNQDGSAREPRAWLNASLRF